MGSEEKQVEMFIGDPLEFHEGAFNRSHAMMTYIALAIIFAIAWIS